MSACILVPWIPQYLNTSIIFFVRPKLAHFLAIFKCKGRKVAWSMEHGAQGIARRARLARRARRNSIYPFFSRPLVSPDLPSCPTMALLLAHSQEQSIRFLDMEWRGDLQFNPLRLVVAVGVETHMVEILDFKFYVSDWHKCRLWDSTICNLQSEMKTRWDMLWSFSSVFWAWLWF